MFSSWRPVNFVGSYTDSLPPASAPEVAFAGRSNVGKSSAINVLLGVKGLARTSRTPGRTQLINLFSVGERWVAVDLPGYGFAKVGQADRERWRQWIEGYVNERDALAGVVVLIDARVPPQDRDGQLLAWLGSIGRQRLVLATKLDGVKLAARARTLADLARAHGLATAELIGFSAEHQLGVDEARDAIDQLVRGRKPSSGDRPPAGSPRPRTPRS